MKYCYRLRIDSINWYKLLSIFEVGFKPRKYLKSQIPPETKRCLKLFNFIFFFLCYAATCRTFVVNEKIEELKKGIGMKRSTTIFNIQGITLCMTVSVEILWYHSFLRYSKPKSHCQVNVGPHLNYLWD